MDQMQKLNKVKGLVFTVLIVFGMYHSSFGCSPLNVPTLVSQSIVGNNLLLNWQSSTTYKCPDVIDVEIACNSKSYTGQAAFTYTSSVVTGASTPYSYPTMTINISSLCPGTTYKFRARERNNGSTTASGWTGNFTFTTPGTFIPPSGNITANPPVITLCPQGSSTLIPTFSNTCGSPSNFTYTWTPSNSLSCANCFSPVATPTATTIYTLNSSGGQLGCWGLTNTVQVTVITTPPSVGTATIAPAVMCAGNSAMVGITSYSGAIQWQSSATSTGPWVNVPGATSSSFSTGALNTSMCYRAYVTGCGSALTSNTVCVTVNPNPTVTVANTNTICAGQVATFTANGATSYAWSAGANSTGVNTASAAPGSTTSYTVTGTSAGCTGTAVATVVVNPMPVPTATNNGPVCTGGNIILTGGGGGTYQWSGPNSFSSGAASPNISPAATTDAGVYTVTVNLAGCIGVASTTVTVFTPTASANNTGPYCAGATIQLNTSAGTSHSWTGPASFASGAQNPTIVNAQPSMSGDYTVVINLGSCSASATTSVTVYALPTVTASSNSPICDGQALNLLGSGAVTYTWSGPGGFSSNAQTPGIAIASPSNSGTYSYSVTDVNGCSSGTTIPVTVNPLPVIVVNSPTACVNQSINLSATGGTLYSWAGPNSYSSASQNPVITNVTTAMTGPYTVTVQDINSCINTAVANVSVIALPVPTISNNGPLCAGATLNLTSGGGVNYNWTGPGYNGPNQNPTITNVTVGDGGVYTVSVSANGCGASISTTVVVNPLPVPVANSNSPVCLNSAINFSATGGGNYTWIGPANFFNTQQNPSIPAAALNNAGTYTLVIQDANNCVNSVTLPVVVNPLPLATAVGTTVCENFNAVLTAGGGTSYLWTGPNSYTSTSASPVFAGAQLSSNGQYTVLVTDVNTCTNTAVATLVVNPAPIANIQTNSPICINNALALSGTGGLTYSWTGPNGFTSTLQNPTIQANTTAYTGNYALTVTDANGCIGTAFASATVNPIPTLAVFSSANRGCRPLCVTFTVQSSAGVQNTNWIFGNGTSSTQQTAQSCYNASGIFTVNTTVTDNNNCSNAMNYTVEVFPQPVADFNFAPIKPIAGSDEVHFTDASHSAEIVAWNWYFTNTAGTNTSSMQHPSYIYMDAGDYVAALVVKSENGCTDTITKVVTVGEDFGIFVPNAFTPNGDGVNDTFQPKGFGIVKYELQIFDRWGEKIFETTEFEKGWDGIRQKKSDINYTVGKEEVYVWKIKATSVFGKAHEYTGHVTLIK
jgi:gliding motility-associated-like protein